MKYNQELNIMLAKANKTKKWLCAKLGKDRSNFWRKVSSNKLTKEQKAHIAKTIANG